MEKLKVLVADDSVISRKAVVEAVEGTGMGMVVHTAPNSSIAIEWLQQCTIDVVLLDAFMMGQNCLDILKTIKKKHPDVEVIILSDGDPLCAEITIEALASGAFDFVLKTEETDPLKTVAKIRNQLGVLFTQIKVKKYSIPGAQPECLGDVKAAGTSGGHHLHTFRNKPGMILRSKPDLVLIASSTGGPAALENIFKRLPCDFPRPILVVQHMPPDFTNIFAQTLDKKSPLHVVEAVDGDVIKTGRIVIAAGGMHMTVNRLENDEKVVRLDQTPYINGVRPSADVLFHSVSDAYEGKSVLAVILTGMGNDGASGVSEMKERCDCYCITQSENSCVVYGMPRCVREAGLSDEEADIGDVARRICQMAAFEGC